MSVASSSRGRQGGIAPRWWARRVAPLSATRRVPATSLTEHGPRIRRGFRRCRHDVLRRLRQPPHAEGATFRPAARICKMAGIPPGGAACAPKIRPLVAVDEDALARAFERAINAFRGDDEAARRAC